MKLAATALKPRSRVVRVIGLVGGTMIVLLLITWLLALASASSIGHLEGLSSWFKRHSTALHLWRLGIYAATAYGWIWMRKRLQVREPDAESRRRLLTAEIAALITICLLECALLIQPA